MNTLGIIDWGIGGISIVKLIKETYGDIPVIYFSDTGVTPYGRMTRAELVARLNEVIAYLKSQGVERPVIGCNAASTAIPFLADHDVPIDGVIETAVAETVKQKPESLGLIGGRRTVVSGVYRRAFAERGIPVTQRIAQPLSGLIESGDLSSVRLRTECARILTPVRRCSHILLACTHYASILPVMKEFVSPHTRFIDPVPAMVKRLSCAKLTADGSDLYLTTGEPKAMKKAAKAAFDWQITAVKKVTV